MSSGEYRSPRLTQICTGGGEGALSYPVGHAPGIGTPPPSPCIRGHRPGRGRGRPGIYICHGLDPPPGARVALGGWEAELHLPLDHVVHRDPKSRRVGGRDGISLPVGEGEEGDPQGEVHKLEQLAGPLGVLCQEGGSLERPSLSGEWGPGPEMVSWPAARMRRPTAERRSLSRKKATSMALHGFASSRAVSGLSAATRDSCGPTSPVGLSTGSAAGGSGSSSDVSAGCEGSGGLRLSASPSLRPANWVAVPWDASASMGRGGGASIARGTRFPRWVGWQWPAHLGRSQAPVHLRSSLTYPRRA